jgi:cytochrome c-type biogenesis protein CcmF
LVSKNPRRYGGYVVHIGVVLIFIGIAGSSFFKIEKQLSLQPGESVAVGRYLLKYSGLQNSEDAHIASQAAVVEVYLGGQHIATMHPEKRFYKRQKQPTTEVAIRPTLRDDLYVVLGGYDEVSRLATFQIFVNPLQSWLWIGGILLVLGACITMMPNPAERHALALTRSQDDLAKETVTT